MFTVGVNYTILIFKEIKMKYTVIIRQLSAGKSIKFISMYPPLQSQARI